MGACDSIVVNPHKWLFTPFDLSVLYCRDLGVLKNAFSLVPEYLKTSDEGSVKNGMDYGIQLGRRFRALKLWFVIRYFGREGLIARLREHCRLARPVRIMGRSIARFRNDGAGAVRARVLSCVPRGRRRS
jgi:aromatic-L-amino-acid decarboxylase